MTLDHRTPVAAWFTCPVCKGGADWLSTTNEWERYCPACDVRFNAKGEPREADASKWPRYPAVGILAGRIGK